MNFNRWTRPALLVFLSWFFVGTSACQHSSRPVPPLRMRLCLTYNGKDDCNNMEWTGEFYELRRDGETKIDSRYWITQWDKDGIVMTGKTAYPVFNSGFPIVLHFEGRIAADGGHIKGIASWTFGFNDPGPVPYSFTWKKEPSNSLSLYVGEFESIHYSKTKSTIILPSGASEAYVTFPDEVRAILQPDLPVLESDVNRPCDGSETNPKLALELARYAYRADEIERGNCWTDIAVSLNSPKAYALLGVGYQMGFRGPKDDRKAFEIFKANMLKKDPWDVFFLYNCYLDGRGTDKNVHEATFLTSYMITHDDTMQVMNMVGSDDAALMRQKARLELFVSPPTRTETSCTPAHTLPNGYHQEEHCVTKSVVDTEEFQRRLDKIK